MGQPPDQNFRGYAGTVASGSVRPGDRIIVQPGSQQATITRIVTMDGDLAAAETGDAVTLCLDGKSTSRPRRRHCRCRGQSVQVTDQFAAHLVWMDDQRHFCRSAPIS